MADRRILIASTFVSALTAALMMVWPGAARELGARLGVTAATSATTIPLQVRLASTNGTPVNGPKTVTFGLYTVASGGSPLWTETWTAGNAVQVTDGVASVLLGSRTALPQSVVANNSMLYLGITIDVEAEMQPRIQLGSAPIAMTVPDGAITASKIATGAITSRNMAPQRYSVFTTSIISSTLGLTPKPTQTAVSFTCATDCVALATYRGLLYSSIANGRVDAWMMVDGNVMARGLANPANPDSASYPHAPVTISRQIPLAAGNHTIAIAFICLDLSTCYYYGDFTGQWEGLEIILFAQ